LFTTDAKQELFKHYGYVTKIVRFKTNLYDLDYDDTLNFVFEKLCENDFKVIRSFQGESKFSTFLTVVVNHMIFRSARGKKHLTEVPDIAGETPLDLLIGQLQIQRLELFAENLNQWLGELDYQEKLVLEMKFFKGININQISKILGLTRYKTQKKMDAGLDFLRDKLREIRKIE
jgi:RNA polymerase sigma factor (sigma-70 family)